MVRLKLIAWLVALFAAGLACSSSVLSAPNSNSPLDSNSLSTIVAGTANAAALQTAQVVSLTPPMASTSTETVASTPITTATPLLVFSSYGTALGQQADGSTLFIDRQLGYQITIQSVWTPFRINESEFYKMWTLPVSQQTLVQGNLTSIQSMDPHIFRLFAFDLRDGHFQTWALTNTDVSWSQSVDNYSQALSGLQQQYAPIYKDIKLLSSKTQTNPSKLEVNVAEFTYVYQGTKFYEKLTLFKIKAGGLLMIRSDTADALKSLNMPEIDQLQGSLKLYSG